MSFTCRPLGLPMLVGGKQQQSAKRGVRGARRQQVRGHGVVCDLRQPDMLRFAPTPLYNTFEETHAFVGLLREALAVA